MDITFRMPAGVFNLRAAAVILHDGCILAMKDDRSPYYYLPGGRIRLHETAESAVLREVAEELGVQARIDRPLWVNQGFFNEDVTRQDFHEICLYFLVDVSHTDLIARGDCFLQREGRRTHRFHWLSLHTLQDEYFYPLFLKERALQLPEHFTCLYTPENALPPPGADLAFQTEEGDFTLRACSIMAQDGRILAAKHADMPGYHLPGGRVKLHEGFEAALHRELLEETGMACPLLRPLWFDQRFYLHPVTGQRQHELCLYMLTQAPSALAAQSEFFYTEGGVPHRFRWLTREDAAAMQLFPAWLASHWDALPAHPKMLTHHELT